MFFIFCIFFPVWLLHNACNVRDFRELERNSKTWTNSDGDKYKICESCWWATTIEVLGIDIHIGEGNMSHILRLASCISRGVVTVGVSPKSLRLLIWRFVDYPRSLERRWEEISQHCRRDWWHEKIRAVSRKWDSASSRLANSRCWSLAPFALFASFVPKHRT